MEIFKKVPVDPDTIIINEKEIDIDQIPALYQEWGWDGIIAESLIFRDKDVENLNDEELFEKVKTNFVTASENAYTIKRSASGFTFVNFNFKD